MGVMYVKCQEGCTSLFPEERFNFSPPDCVVEKLEDLRRRGYGTMGGEKGVTPEGGAVNDPGADLPF